jgi:hypothetical protein
MLGTPDVSSYGWFGFGSYRGLFEWYSGLEVLVLYRKRGCSEKG